MACVYHGRTKGEGCGQVNRLLWFTIFCDSMSLHICTGKMFILFSRLANFLGGKKLFFWLSACSVLIVVPLI